MSHRLNPRPKDGSELRTPADGPPRLCSIKVVRWIRLGIAWLVLYQAAGTAHQFCQTTCKVVQALGLLQPHKMKHSKARRDSRQPPHHSSSSSLQRQSQNCLVTLRAALELTCSMGANLWML